MSTQSICKIATLIPSLIVIARKKMKILAPLNLSVMDKLPLQCFEIDMG